MFQGYTQETVDFMWGIRFNNERGWFLEHKQQYQTQPDSSAYSKTEIDWSG